MNTELRRRPVPGAAGSRTAQGATARRRHLWPIVIALWILALLGLHIAAGFTFPLPWADETWNLVPAIGLARDGAIDAATMLNRGGIYWVPPGIYLFNGAVYALLGFGDVATARWIAWGEALVSLLFMGLVLRQLFVGLKGAAAGLVIVLAAWSVSVPFQLISNVGRPEALVTLLSLAGLYALVCGRLYVLYALTGLCLFTHQLHAVPLLALSAASLPRLRLVRPRWIEWALGALLVAVAAFEGWRWLSSEGVYEAQMRYQLANKASRTLQVLPLIVILALVAVGMAWFAWRALRSRSAVRSEPDAAVDTALACLVYGASSLFVRIYGQEMWYSTPLLLGAFFTFASGVVLVMRHKPGLPPVLPAAVAVLALGIFQAAPWASILLKGTWATMPVGMQATQDARIDHDAIVGDGELSRLAASPRTLLNPYLYLLWVRHPQEARPMTYNYLSDQRPGMPITHVVDVLKSTTPNLELAPVPAPVVRGYVCSESRDVSSPRGTLVLRISVVSETGRDAPYQPCATATGERLAGR